MVEYDNINYFVDQTHLKINNNEDYFWLKNLKVHQDYLRILIKMLPKYFKELILKLKE